MEQPGAKGHCRFNVFVPKVDETNSDYCLFENELNTPFLTDADGNIIVKYREDIPFSNFKYFFCKHNNNLTIGGYTLYVKDTDPETLYIKKGGQIEKVGGTEVWAAKIYNTVYNRNDYKGTEVRNAIVLNRDSEYAKAVLNVDYDSFKVYIGATAIICGDEIEPGYVEGGHEITLYFNGEDHFEGRFIRPVTINTESLGFFIDAVDKGEEGSWLPLADVINPLDWRGRAFGDMSIYQKFVDDPSYEFTEEEAPLAKYGYYWWYYGIGDVTLLEGGVKTNVYHPTVNYGIDDLKYGMEVGVSDNINGDPLDKVGSAAKDYLIYHNSEAVTETFKLFIKVSVEYVWGTVTSDEIAITVKKTTGPAAGGEEGEGGE